MIAERWQGTRRFLGSGILSRAVFSLILAALLWGWVTNLDDPEIEKSFANLPLTLVGNTNDLVLLDETRLPTISATLRGPQSMLSPLQAADVRATLDLAGIKETGTRQLDVEINPIPDLRSVRVITTTPRRVSATLDRVATKSFALEVDKGPTIPPYSIGNVDYQTRQVTVRGPASVLDRISRVTLPVGLGDRRESFEAQFTPEARDASGARISSITIEPSSITASVSVERVGRTVSIVPNITGEPPEGYRVRDTSVSPPSITVDGPAEVLAQLIVVSTVPIDLTGRRESFSVYDVPLILPVGTRLIERTAINVEVRIEAEQQRQQVNVRVVVTGLDPGLRATVTPLEIVVILSGSRDRLRQLSGDDVRVELDLRGYQPNSYTLAPRVIVPTDLRADPPQTVRVVIERAVTPTPPPTVTPTPRPTPTPTPPIPTVTPTTTPTTGRREGELLAEAFGG